MVIIRPQLERRLRADPLVSPANASAHEELCGSFNQRSKVSDEDLREGWWLFSSSGQSGSFSIFSWTLGDCRCQGKGESGGQHGVNSPSL